MRPGAGFVIERGSTRGVVALLSAVCLDAQERVDNSGAGWLRIRKLKDRRAVAVGDRAAVVIDEIDDDCLRNARDCQHAGGD